MDGLQLGMTALQAEHKVSQQGAAAESSGLEKKLFDRQSRFEGALMQVSILCQG